MPLTIQNLNVTVAVSGLTSSNPSDISQTVDQINTRMVTGVRHGTEAGRANIVWSGQRTIAPGGDDDINLSTGLFDAFGKAIAFLNMRGITVINRSTGLGTLLTVANAGGTFPSTPWAIPCGPGDSFNFMEREIGLPVVPAVADVLRITNEDGGASAVYDIVLIGVE